MRWLARATLAMLAIAWADDCHDRNIDCSDWAEEGECDSDEMRDWMAEHCPVSCRKCKARPRAPSRSRSRSLSSSSAGSQPRSSREPSPSDAAVEPADAAADAVAPAALTALTYIVLFIVLMLGYSSSGSRLSVCLCSNEWALVTAGARPPRRPFEAPAACPWRIDSGARAATPHAIGRRRCAAAAA